MGAHFSVLDFFPKSQIYRSHNVTGSSFEAPHAPGSFHGDYAYGTYPSNFSGAHGFPEYNYAADTSWPAVEQGASQQFRVQLPDWDGIRESNQLLFAPCAHCPECHGLLVQASAGP